MDTSKVATRLREQVQKFSGEVSAGMGQVARRFVGEMLYGIQASQSVMLTEIVRSLEESSSIKKTEERLSRNLRRKELGRCVQDNVLRMARGRVRSDTLLILDLSDVTKPYARKMQYLARVRDGSEGELGNGYWTLHVVGAELDRAELVPLYQRLYSVEAPQFISENEEILRAVDRVSEAVEKRGIWVIDRGGDRMELLQGLLDRRLRFLIRLVGNRHLLCGHQQALAEGWAERCPCAYEETIVKISAGQETTYRIRFGYRPVRLPDRPEPLYLLVVKGYGQKPLMLLTNVPLRRSRKVLWRMVRAYLKRWSIEETIRFVKQSYDVENVRVLKYAGLQNLWPILLGVMYFAMVVLDTHEKLQVMVGCVLKAAKRVFGIGEFKYYAIADGMHGLFTRHPGRPQRQRCDSDPQILLFELESP